MNKQYILKVCGKLLDSFLGKKKDNKYVQQYGVKVSNNNNDDHNNNDDVMMTMMINLML